MGYYRFEAAASLSNVKGIWNPAGATGGNRTHNLLIKSQILYQLSYRHKQSQG